VRFRVATFDCYGTLVDWEGGLGTFLYDLLLRLGDADPPSGRELRERWEEIQFELIQDDYMDYSRVLSLSLSRFLQERGWPYNENDGHALERAMGAWQPFPDTVPALRRAKEAGLRLAILSNTDRAIIGHTLKQLDGVEFDEVVVAEDVRAYKPSPENFQALSDRLGHPRDEVLHVAFGFKYDIGPAQAAGYRAAWINRNREPLPGPARPEYEWTDLWGLAELAESEAR
jgi:2-haloacid dehalogenase